WHATVLCAVALAVSVDAPTSQSARKRAVTRAVKEVAHYLGNTPTVCRASYVDPRVIDLYNDGVTVRDDLDRLGAGAQFGDRATSSGGGSHNCAYAFRWPLFAVCAIVMWAKTLLEEVRRPTAGSAEAAAWAARARRPMPDQPVEIVHQPGVRIGIVTKPAEAD